MSATRFRLVGLAAFLVGMVTAAPAGACPFCSMSGTTLTGDVSQASMVLFGTLKNPTLDPNSEFGGGSTELHLEAVIKKHDLLGDKKVVLLPRYVPSDDKNPIKYLVFCDVFKGKIDPYRGVAIKPDSAIVKYLTGAMAVKDKDDISRLRYFFDYLDNADTEITNDAYKEFGNADAKHYKELCKHLPADRLAKWLQDPKTPTFRYGLYAVLLGHTGEEKHAELLHQMLADPKKKVSSGVDGLLAGYILLKPKEGWAFLLDLVKDGKKDFLVRYGGLRAIRFFMETRPDVLPKADLLKGVEELLDQSDIADLAIEDLRKWKSYDSLDRILALNGKESHDIPIVRRAILRFALCCPEQPKAVNFVKDMRKKDADWVKEVEELLQLEANVTK